MIHPLFANANLRKMIGLAAIAVIVLNFFFFLLNLYNEVVFWTVIIIVLTVAFPLLNHLKKVNA